MRGVYTMGRPVVHFEIGCKDNQETQDFYRGLFDWEIQAAGPAAIINTGSTEGIQGHITSLGHEPHQYVTVYVEVDDIPATLAQTTALGGKVLVPEIPIPTGTFAWISDPGGNVIGLVNSSKVKDKTV